MMNKRKGVLIAALVLVAACAKEEPPRGTAIIDVTVIDAINGVREHQTVVFDGDKIITVASADAPLAPAMHSIDGSGKFLIPGLWDMHVHLTYDDAFTDSMPAMFLAYGITSVRDTGGLLHNSEQTPEIYSLPS